MTDDATKRPGTPATGSTWNYHPELPLKDNSVFDFKRGPLEAVKLLWNSWKPISDRWIVIGVSVLTWFYLSPSLQVAHEFKFDWIATLYFRNLLILTILAGGMHLYLYTFKMQGNRFRYDGRPFHKKNASFTFSSQFADNVFWSIASGVTVWTAYEIIGLWAFANGYMPMLSLTTNWTACLLWFVLLPFYGLLHFYWIHRLLHWGPLYRWAHSLHHRNVNVGPWSGMSMHPMEHILYLSSVLIHFVIASHPLHLIYHLQSKVLLAISSHAGYESIALGENSTSALRVGDFFHQLHHRYFECNYGEPEVPCDRWFGTLHDGSEEATARTRARLKEMRKKK